MWVHRVILCQIQTIYFRQSYLIAIHMIYSPGIFTQDDGSSTSPVDDPASVCVHTQMTIKAAVNQLSQQ